MATMTEINPQDGDVIKGATGTAPVCVVRGEMFWNGHLVSAYRGDAFEAISRSGHVPTEQDLADRDSGKAKARKDAALDRFYA